MLTWLELPLIVGLLGVLCTGVAMLLSALFVYFRDIQPIWEVVSQIIFYASPVIIPIDDGAAASCGTRLSTSTCSTRWRSIFQQFRHAMVNHATPSAGSVLGSQAAAASSRWRSSLAIFVLGFCVFNRTAPRVAEDL